MAKFHVNDDGDVRRCTANKRPCKFGEAAHYEDAETARTAVEKANAKVAADAELAQQADRGWRKFSKELKVAAGEELEDGEDAALIGRGEATAAAAYLGFTTRQRGWLATQRPGVQAAFARHMLANGMDQAGDESVERWTHGQLKVHATEQADFEDAMDLDTVVRDWYYAMRDSGVAHEQALYAAKKYDEYSNRRDFDEDKDRELSNSLTRLGRVDLYDREGYPRRK